MIKFLCPDGLSVFLFLIIFYAAGQAQDRGILRGFLSDSLSGEALPYGNILIREINQGTSTDSKGYYLFPSLPPGLCTIVVSYIGYESKVVTTRVFRNETTLINISLKPVNIEIQTVEKIAERGEKNKPDLGVYKATIKELEAIPQGVETDILRSIQNVPGVTFTSDISASYFVRGGSNNQNLVLLNNAVIYNPFHALGMFSIVDPEMINSFEFYKGGFPTEYSDRTSSVLDFSTKDGNRNRFGAAATVSLLTAKTVIEGPIPSGSFIVTGRKSISDRVLLNFYNNKNLPINFYDLSFKANYSNQTFWENAKFTVHGFISDDQITDKSLLKADYKWKNQIFGIRYLQVSDSPLSFELNLSSSTFNGEVFPKLSSIKPKKNEVTDHTFKGDFKYIYSSNDILTVGIKVSEIKTGLFLQNAFGEIANIGPVGANNDWSVYGKYQFLRFDNLGIELGTRVNFIKLSQESGGILPIEPRFSLAYSFSPSLKMQLSAGIFNQALTTLSDVDEVLSIFEPWMIVPAYIGITRSYNYSSGFELIFTDFWKFKTEAYYKKTTNLPLVNKFKIFPEDPDLIAVESQAYGLELFNRLSLSDISFTSTYSFAWVEYEAFNIKYHPRFDIRNSVNLLLESNLGKGWSFSIMWNYKSGFPFTKLLGYYDKFYFNDDPNNISILNFYSKFSLLDRLNTGHSPDYHRLDLNISKKISLQILNLYINLNILNLYDRENLFYFDRETGERVNMLPFLPSISIKAEF